MKKLKQKDEVVVQSGKDRGKRSIVNKIDYERKRVIVENVNIVKRHSKPSNGSVGGIIEKPGYIDISKVLVFCKKCKKGVKTSIRVLSDKKKVRACKVCNETIM